VPAIGCGDESFDAALIRDDAVVKSTVFVTVSVDSPRAAVSAKTWLVVGKLRADS
jgi:hypothetical protein